MLLNRFIPDVSNLNRFYGLFFSRFENQKPYTEEDYLHVIQTYEIECEDYFKDLFEKLDIQSSTKTDRYSLPYSNEIKHVQESTKNLYNTFDLSDFARVVVKELLNIGVEKLRFYVTGDVIINKLQVGREVNCKVVLKFRFYI